MIQAVLVALLALVASVAFAAPSNFDRADQSRQDPRVAAATSRLRSDPALGRLGRIEHIDERFGVPSFVWANPGAARASGATKESAARDYLAAIAPLYGLDADDAREATLRYVHDTGRGGIVASFSRRIDGIDVFRDRVQVLMDRSLQPVAVSGYIPARSTEIVGRFRITGPAAIERALSDFGGRSELTPGREPEARKVYFHEGARLVPGWHIELLGPDQAFAYVISADDGQLLYRNSLMANDAFGYRVWADATSEHAPYDGPQASAPTPHPAGFISAYDPPYVAPSLISLQNSPFSMNDPWLVTGATQTSGNNADVYADIASPDGFTAGDFRATTTSPGVFDYTYDLNLAPGANATQQMASITQAFYTVNYLHDWYYDAGFNEALGNAQADNFGRGGVGGDRMIVEVQDFGGTNNANMSTPSDGSSPKMQLYVYNPGLTGGVVVSGPGLTGARRGGTANFGPQTFNLTGQVAAAVDAVAPTTDGCSALTNGASVTGKIALIDRGTCNFTDKVKNAQDAGAIGVLVVDNLVSAIPPSMGGSDPSIVIPSMQVTKAFGDSIRAALGSGVVTITLDRPAAIARDAALDNQLVAHEWGHYISARLAGSLGNTMGGALGEGWGDFHALMMTVRPEDAGVPANLNFEGIYSFAGFSESSPYSFSYFFGSRRLPYSTNLLKNPLTFKHISDSEALPPGFDYQIFSPSNSEVHNAGEIWCTMLWECYAALLRDTGRLTFEQARLRMRDYLVAAYQLTPNTPTLLEARDALLAAAAANDPADYVAFWQAFAKRGAGMGAIAPDRNSVDNSPVTESYLVGGDLRFVSLSIDDDFKSCDHDGYLDEGEIGTLTVTLQNTGAVNLNATTATVSSTYPAIQFPYGNSIVFSPSTPLGLTTGTVKIGLSNSVALAAVSIQVAFGDPAQVTPHPVNGSKTLYVRANESPSTTETFEKPDFPWTKGGFSTIEDGTFSWLEVSSTSHRLFGPDPSGVSDQWIMTPPLVRSGETFTLSFQHQHSFETDSGVRYDGGVIEISTDNGINWVDASTFGAVPYNGTLTTLSGNPLGGRQAFCGPTAGYPSLRNVSINFGTSLAGQTVRIRFRVGTDESASAPGWQIDNVAVAGITNSPFFSLSTDPNVCEATAVADALPTSLEFAVEGAIPARGNVPLSFALPEAGVVEIGVFDVTGRRVETLANGNFAAGRHRLAWSPSRSLGSGVYFVRMTAGGRTFTRRVVTLK